MADLETEQWAEKSRRIEAEKMKAAKALGEEKPDKSALAFLDPKTTKVKGFSNDTDVIMFSAERMGGRSMILAVAGVVLGIVGYTGGMVAAVNDLGMGGMIISAIPQTVGSVCMGASCLMALITIVAAIVYKVKRGQKFGSALWSAVGAIAVVSLYFWARWLLTRIG